MKRRFYRMCIARARAGYTERIQVEAEERVMRRRRMKEKRNMEAKVAMNRNIRLEFLRCNKDRLELTVLHHGEGDQHPAMPMVLGRELRTHVIWSPEEVDRIISCPLTYDTVQFDHKTSEWSKVGNQGSSNSKVDPLVRSLILISG